jgi:hypothetical protein
LYTEAFGQGQAGPPFCASSNGLYPDGGTGRFVKYEYAAGDDSINDFLLSADCPPEVQDSAPNGNLFQVWLNSVNNRRVSIAIPDTFSAEKCDNCATCPANQYDTDITAKGSGKACQNSIWMYVLPAGYRLPLFMKAGPSSLGNKGSLMPYLTNAQNIGLGGKYQTILTRFSLEKKTFNSGLSTSKINCKKISIVGLADGTLRELANLHQEFTTKYLAYIKSQVSSSTNE